MVNLAYAEKRAFMRMNVDSVLSFKIEGQDSYHDGHTIDLSGGGLSFLTSTPLETDTVLLVQIASTHHKIPPLKANLRVIRVDEVSSGYKIAGQFETLT